jgi:hypothetical protein
MFSLTVLMAILLSAAAAASVAALIVPGRYYSVGAAIASGAALVGFSLYSVLGLESRVGAHRTFAHSLWMVCEDYRSLISEANEGLVESGELLSRRDRLIGRLHALYERGFGVDQPGYEAARLARLPADRAA